MALLLKIVGVAWMVLALLLILLSALMYAREADSLWTWLCLLWDFFDPSRVLNSLVIMAVILPGFLVYELGRRLSDRRK